MASVDSCVRDLIKIFAKYAGKDGDPTSLTKGELMELLQNEMKITVDKADKARADQLFRDLDDNKDGVVDFQEFMSLVGTLATAVHSFMTELQQDACP